MLSGGSAVRFQGADKASIEIAGVTLLEHVLGALAEVPEVVVVGDEVLTSRPVSFVREDPAGGGPAAGLLAGLAGFPRPPRLVVVLAVDMPLVTTATVSRLLLVGGGGRCAARGRGRSAAVPLRRLPHRGAARRPRRRSSEHHGLSDAQPWLPGCELAEVPALAWEARDVDTWDDLTELRERLGG